MPVESDGKWYLPDCLDDEAWQRTYDSQYTSTDAGLRNEEKRKTFIEKNPDWKSFREKCYAEAKENLKNCHPSDGWCVECSRKDGWDWDKERAKAAK